ncbi:hypothetical protein Taro_034888 [Colocasia esculenta]|uniref:Uncharacterized protein n=1 Tax=Colocasia esculenta TaxID=4460 RepID=A0A843WBG6_COLES|nr:hypothetical protein [Colocasia esculenta]
MVTVDIFPVAHLASDFYLVAGGSSIRERKPERVLNYLDFKKLYIHQPFSSFPKLIQTPARNYFWPSALKHIASLDACWNLPRVASWSGSGGLLDRSSILRRMRQDRLATPPAKEEPRGGGDDPISRRMGGFRRITRFRSLRTRKQVRRIDWIDRTIFSVVRTM